MMLSDYVASMANLDFFMLFEYASKTQFAWRGSIFIHMYGGLLYV